MKTFYFGCVGQAGHYLHDEHLHSVWKESPPWNVDRGEVDGKLMPHRPDCKSNSYCICGNDTEGIAAIHHKDGWTAMAFWDRSVDKRGACNSVFFAEGTHDFNAMVQIAKDRFPSIWKRFKFNVVPVELATI